MHVIALVDVSPNPLIPPVYDLVWVLAVVLWVAPAALAVVLALRAGWPAVHTLAWVLLAIVLPVLGPLLVVWAYAVTRPNRSPAASSG